LQKRNIIFIGSFKTKNSDQVFGGQTFACETLINSKLNNFFNWYLIDTTSKSNKNYYFFIRLFYALKRFLKLIYYLTFKNIDYLLIFTGDGNSFIEKGVITFICSFIFNKKVILAPRSGTLQDNIEKSKIFKIFAKVVFKYSYKIICQSEIWKSFFTPYANKEDKLIIIENAIEFTNYSNLKIFHNKDTVSILFLAWVDFNKGIFELIDACLMLKKQNILFKLYIAGDGRHFNEIKFKIIKYDLSENIFMLGWVSNKTKYNLLENSDIFILPTHFEGYPNSLIEAMLSGKACIATKIGSIPDIIKHMENGLLINKNNSNEIFESLKLLISDTDLRFKLSNQARKSIINRNSTDVMIDKYLKILF